MSNYIHYQIVYNTSYHSPYIHLHLVILNRNKVLRPSFTSFVRLGGLIERFQFFIILICEMTTYEIFH